MGDGGRCRPRGPVPRRGPPRLHWRPHGWVAVPPSSVAPEAHPLRPDLAPSRHPQPARCQAGSPKASQ
eukprot:8734334-Lingulodinium_polyedra.AAC.1